ncbi:hypothetical protein CEXT_496911 [Caerostris extrusa]|uniref:Uncharacterized protein n=1 Tax=Caerostris extrusa TaxID=172846 RepID=A0AAV4V9U9_CAEEX|nr:hypothetical protein CEXT_496911 [Caerostris extrusa]
MPKASLFLLKSREQLSDSLRAKCLKRAKRCTYANASIEIQLHTAANLKSRASFSDRVSSAKVVDVMSRYCVVLHFALLQFYVKMPDWPCATEGGEEDIKIKSAGGISIFMMMDYCPGKSRIQEFFGKGKKFPVLRLRVTSAVSFPGLVSLL